MLLQILYLLLLFWLLSVCLMHAVFRVLWLCGLVLGQKKETFVSSPVSVMYGLYIYVRVWGVFECMQVLSQFLFGTCTLKKYIRIVNCTFSYIQIYCNSIYIHICIYNFYFHIIEIFKLISKSNYINILWSSLIIIFINTFLVPCLPLY